MKEVLIDGVIGFSWYYEKSVTLKDVKKQLEGLKKDEEIKVTINSPGGSVYEGITIFNLIRDYAKTNPVSIKINCIAMSMGSYIALAARTVNRNLKLTASENSIFMIHNPWGAVIGDYRALKKEADYLEKLSALYGSAHAAIAQKPDKEIRAAMDEETYYVGKEIQEMGWANDFEIISQTENASSDTSSSTDEEKRNVLIAKAQHEVEHAKKIARAAYDKDPVAYFEEFEKAVAFCNVPKSPEAENAETGEKINSGGVEMDGNKPLTIEDLRAQNKPLYDSVIALGETAGVDKERARVSAHLLLGEKSGSLAIAAKHIKSGVSVSDETALAEYHAAKLDSTHLARRDADNVGDVNTGGESGGIDDDVKLQKAFEDGVKGKKPGGEKWEE